MARSTSSPRSLLEGAARASSCSRAAPPPTPSSPPGWPWRTPSARAGVRDDDSRTVGRAGHDGAALATASTARRSTPSPRSTARPGSRSHPIAEDQRERAREALVQVQADLRRTVARPGARQRRATRRGPVIRRLAGLPPAQLLPRRPRRRRGRGCARRVRARPRQRRRCCSPRPPCSPPSAVLAQWLWQSRQSTDWDNSFTEPAPPRGADSRISRLAGDVRDASLGQPRAAARLHAALSGLAAERLRDRRGARPPTDDEPRRVAADPTSRHTSPHPRPPASPPPSSRRSPPPWRSSK